MLVHQHAQAPSTVECRNPNTFGFRTDQTSSRAIFVPKQFCPKSERKFISKIQTKSFERLILTKLDHFIYACSFLYKTDQLSFKQKSFGLNDRNPNQICLNDRSLGFRHYSDFECSVFDIPLYITGLVFRQFRFWMLKSKHKKSESELGQTQTPLEQLVFGLKAQKVV